MIEVHINDAEDKMSEVGAHFNHVMNRLIIMKSQAQTGNTKKLQSQVRDLKRVITWMLMAAEDVAKEIHKIEQEVDDGQQLQAHR